MLRYLSSFSIKHKVSEFRKQTLEAAEDRCVKGKQPRDFASNLTSHSSKDIRNRFRTEV
jgi:hypothetical protein